MTRLKNTLCFAGVAAILSTLAAHAHAGAREGPQAPVAIEKVGHGPAAPLSDARRDRRTGYGLPGAAETMTPAELDAVRGMGSPPAEFFWSGGSISFETNLTGSATF